MTLTDFQLNVWSWFKHCFKSSAYNSVRERTFRFTEEALELAQACGVTREEVEKLLNYVYGRPVGEVKQEVGGVLITLSTLCSVQKISLRDAAETELSRVRDFAVIKKIRAKQASKVQGLE